MRLLNKQQVVILCLAVATVSCRLWNENQLNDNHEIQITPLAYTEHSWDTYSSRNYSLPSYAFIPNFPLSASLKLTAGAFKMGQDSKLQAFDSTTGDTYFEIPQGHDSFVRSIGIKRPLDAIQLIASSVDVIILQAQEVSPSFYNVELAGMSMRIKHEIAWKASFSNCTTELSLSTSFVVSSDGNYLAMVLRENGQEYFNLVVLDAQSGTILAKIVLNSVGDSLPSYVLKFSPDNSALAVCIGNRVTIVDTTHFTHNLTSVAANCQHNQWTFFQTDSVFLIAQSIGNYLEVRSAPIGSMNYARTWNVDMTGTSVIALAMQRENEDVALAALTVDKYGSLNIDVFNILAAGNSLPILSFIIDPHFNKTEVNTDLVYDPQGFLGVAAGPYMIVFTPGSSSDPRVWQQNDAFYANGFDMMCDYLCNETFWMAATGHRTTDGASGIIGYEIMFEQ